MNACQSERRGSRRHGLALHSTRVAVVALGALGLATALGCASAQPAPPGTRETTAYRVAPPDELRISVLPDPEIDRSVTVRPDGRISIDLVGDVQASGRTPEEIAADVQQRIAKYKRDPVVTVTVVRSMSTAITVLGEVLGPQTFPLDKDTRLAEALGKVGGTTLMAARSRIRIVRPQVDGDTQVFHANLDAITKGDLSTNLLLREGDIIYVPPSYPAQIGYWIAGLLYPVNQLLGTGGSVAVRVATGGL
jgi:polysaccharide export outer membrane protein